jgi:hypothetical protein
MIIVLVIFYEAVAIAITALGCNLEHRRHCQAAWYVGLIGAILTATIFSLPSDWHFLTHPESWSWGHAHHKEESLSDLVFEFVWLTGMALPVATFVVYLSRKIHRESSHVA